VLVSGLSSKIRIMEPSFLVGIHELGLVVAS